MSDKAFIALGANLGDPARQLRIAAGYLKAISVADFATSSIWQSEPEGFDEQVSPFFNAVIRLGFEGAARDLLGALQNLELMMGRQAHNRNDGPYESRRIDLDLIDFAGECHDEPGLQLPHPRAHLRRFVLVPLQEIDDSFQFPDTEKKLQALIDEAPANPMTNKGRLVPGG